jgi:hypothetical protein
MAGRKGEKLWRDALRIAVEGEDHEGRRKLRVIAEKCVELAMDGDLGAIKEIGDRMDGRVPMAIANADDEPLRIEHSAAPAKLMAYLDSIAERKGE